MQTIVKISLIKSSNLFDILYKIYKLYDKQITGQIKKYDTSIEVLEGLLDRCLQDKEALLDLDNCCKRIMDIIKYNKYLSTEFYDVINKLKEKSKEITQTYPIRPIDRKTELFRQFHEKQILNPRYQFLSEYELRNLHINFHSDEKSTEEIMDEIEEQEYLHLMNPDNIDM